jgi:DNA-binding NtrC family response regulator
MKTSIIDSECKSSTKVPEINLSQNYCCGSKSENNQHISRNHPYRILVADDEPGIRQLNSDLLKEEGYTVDTVANGVLAWRALERNYYDLLITDNLMPRMSGVELLEKLHTVRKAVPVIMVTGTMPSEEVQSQPWFQIATTLLKPYTLQELLKAVRDSLQLPSGVHLAA